MQLDATSIRSALKISNDQTLLLCLAFVHEEEKSNFIRYPEYLSADITSQTNTEKRDLLRVGGLTGSNKAFTAMRCLLPSGARWTFNWVFSRAFPLLLGEDNLKKVCVYFF